MYIHVAHTHTHTHQYEHLYMAWHGAALCVPSPPFLPAQLLCVCSSFFCAPALEQAMKNRSTSPYTCSGPAPCRLSGACRALSPPPAWYTRCLSARKYSFVVFVLCTGIGSSLGLQNGYNYYRGRGECESVVCVCVRESNVCVCVCWGVFCAVRAQLSECFADFKPCAL